MEVVRIVSATLWTLLHRHFFAMYDVKTFSLLQDRQRFTLEFDSHLINATTVQNLSFDWTCSVDVVLATCCSSR